MDSDLECQSEQHQRDHKNKIFMKVVATDRISQLPDHIMHNIVSFLSTTDVVRVGILSKSWHQISTSFPIWDFSESVTGLVGLMGLDRVNEFLNFVNNSLVRQLQENASIQRFRLSLSFHSDGFASRFDSLISLAIQSSVKELSIMLVTPNLNRSYDLPQALFSAKTLTVLRLWMSRYALKLPVDSMIWPSLREISFRYVKIDENISQNLIICCPFIEKFSLIDCQGTKNLELSGFTKLNEVEVEDSRSSTTVVIQNIRIDLLSLQTFSYTGGLQVSRIDMTTCKNLEVLTLRSPCLPDTLFENLISDLPFLRILELREIYDCCYDGSNRVKVSSRSLEMLKLVSESSLEAIIDTPNLHTFQYTAYTTDPFVFSVDTSRLVRTTCEIRIPLFKMKGSYFLKLGELVEYLKQVKHFTLCVTVAARYSYLRNLDHHILIPSYPCIPKIECLKLRFERNYQRDDNADQAEQVINFLMDSLLKICHPESLFISFQDCSDLRKFHSMAMAHKQEKQCCCITSRINCWQLNIEGMRCKQDQIHFNFVW